MPFNSSILVICKNQWFVDLIWHFLSDSMRATPLTDWQMVAQIINPNYLNIYNSTVCIPNIQQALINLNHYREIKKSWKNTSK